MGDDRRPAAFGRRGFLATCAAAAAGGCALFRVTVEPDLVLPAAEGRVRIAAADLPWGRDPGTSLAVQVLGRDGKILLFRDGDGEVRALDMVCTHRGCDVGWDASRKRIVCPCHGSEYGPGGGNLKGPAKAPLRSYEVRMEGADLFLDL